MMDLGTFIRLIHRRVQLVKFCARFLKRIRFQKNVPSAYTQESCTILGVFKHSNTTRKTMEYAGMLLEKGVSTTKIIDETFYQKTFVQNQLLGKALLQSQLYAEGQIIVSNLSEQDFEELHV